jgi:hypothetical protein
LKNREISRLEAIFMVLPWQNGAKPQFVEGFPEASFVVNESGKC